MSEINHKRKRKNGLLSRLKKFGSQGKLGKGFEINSNTYNYFLHVFELCNKNEFESEDDKQLFLENSFKMTQGEEVQLSSNQFTSRVIQTLINLTMDKSIIKRFIKAFKPNLRTICKDPYASHVLEKLLDVISQKWYYDQLDEDEDTSADEESLIDSFWSITKYVFNNYEDFIFDKYGNYIMRKVCQCLSSALHLFSTNQSQQNANVNRLQIPNVIQPIPKAEDKKLRKFRKQSIKQLNLFAEGLFKWPQFQDMFQDETTSGFVQCILVCLRCSNSELVTEAITKIIQTIDENEVIGYPCHLHTLETCISTSTEDPAIFQLIFQKYFKHKLVTFISSSERNRDSYDSAGHYVVERLLLAAPNKEIFEEIFEELENNFGKIYEAGKLSVFVSMSKSCRILKCKQNILVKKLGELLSQEQESSKENFVEVLLRFGKRFKPKEDGTVGFLTELQGCLLLQELLQFHKPYTIIRGFLDMDSAKLSKIVSDPKGSHVIDSFFKSETTGEKNKEKILQKLKEYFVTMACTKFGARVIDNLFLCTTTKEKEMIASSFVPRVSQLNANAFGKFLVIKYEVNLYKRNPNDWIKAIEGNSSKHFQAKKRNKEVFSKLVMDLGLNAGFKIEEHESKPKPTISVPNLAKDAVEQEQPLKKKTKKQRIS